MEEYRERVLWCVWWFFENVEEDSVMEDVDFLYAYDEQDAVDKWMRLDDVPEGATIICVEKDQNE